MTSIILNLKILYKFFQEEDFGTLTDAEFERLEQTLESTEQLIELQRLSLANQTGTEARRALDSLHRLSLLVDKLWEHELGVGFLEQLEEVAVGRAA